jgi:hypothetical protein
MTTWTVPFQGRQQQALGSAAQTVELWGKHAADGRRTAPEWFFVLDGVGHLPVKGDRAVLEAILRSDESRRMMRRGLLLLQDWQYALGDTGSGAERFLADYTTELASV